MLNNSKKKVRKDHYYEKKNIKERKEGNYRNRQLRRCRVFVKCAHLRDKSRLITEKKEGLS